jgi:hypothetical protein
MNLHFSFGCLATRKLIPAFVAVLFLVPRDGYGSWLDMTVQEPTLIGFGTLGCWLEMGGVIEIAADGVVIPDVGGDLTFRTSTFLSVTVSDDGFGDVYSHYEFGSGWAHLAADWSDATGGHGYGEWNGELLGVTLDIHEHLDEETPVLSSHGDVYATFGAGTFDEGLAAILGQYPNTFDGWFRMRTDQIDGDPSSPWRVGGSQSGIDYAGLTADSLPPPPPVPEPQTWSLLVIGVASLVGWRFLGKRAVSGRR